MKMPFGLKIDSRKYERKKRGDLEGKADGGKICRPLNNNYMALVLTWDWSYTIVLKSFQG